MRWAQERSIDISGSITYAEAQQIINQAITEAILEFEQARSILTEAGQLVGGGDLTADRTLGLADSGVTADTYGDATHSPQIIIDQFGRITNAVNIPIAGGGGGGGGGSLTQLDQIITTGSETSVDFTGISQAYNDLIVVIAGSGVPATSSINLGMRVNSDSGNNYGYYRWNHYESSNSNGSSFVDLITYPTTADGEITLPNYKSNASKKTFHALSGYYNPGSDVFPQIAAGGWNNTAAITDLSFFATDGSNFPAGTIITLYGRGTASGGNASVPWYFDPPKVAEFPTAIGSISPSLLADDMDAGLLFEIASNHQGTVAQLKAVPASTSFTATMRLNTAFLNTGPPPNMGMVMSNGTQCWVWSVDGRNAGASLHAMKYSTSGYDGFEVLRQYNGHPINWLRIEYDFPSDTATFSYSLDGKLWFPYTVQGSISSYLSGGVQYIGFGGCTESYGFSGGFSCDHWDDTL
uniref:Jacalin-type lectin domain-containing protein n=1 Tax=Mycena chlorophos TaxID=658473 RepID=A0ABQ0KW95_MYCCL|nr:predicted protein [Mycena chlorophos]